MHKARIVFFVAASLIILNILLGTASAAINETEEKEKINQAYNWLSNSVKDKFESMTVEDLSFSLMALAYDDGLAQQARDALSAKKSISNECWPASGCTVKDTALAVFALSRIGVDTDAAEEWITTQNTTPTELTWFMQVDSHEAANCTVEYDTYSYNFTLNENKKLSKAAGSCLSLSYGNYWFKIASGCYNKKFTIRCDKDFVASLFYQKPSSVTIYVSSDTKRESAGTNVDLKITSVCLKQDGGCNYEATAWAALALIKDHDISIFLPYLVGYSENNKRLSPDAFLFALTGQEDYANALFASQKKSGYWQSEPTAYNKFYDTALVMLALQDYSSEKKTAAKEWLLNEQVKSGESEGSWDGKKRETAFVLFTIWPKEASYIPPYQDEDLNCEDYGYYCEQSYNCNFDDRLMDYTCPSLKVCCMQRYEEQTRTCNEMGGFICDYYMNQICEGDTVSALDGTCCMGICISEEINECESNDRVCRSSCYEGEQESYYSCPYGEICCEEAGGGAATAKSKSKTWLWILLIIILLGAAVAAFLFRDKIKEKFKKKPRFPGPSLGLSSRPIPPRFLGMGKPPTNMPPGRPMMLPPPGKPMPPGKPIPPVSTAPPAQNKFFSLRRSQTDKELDDTLKKLKQISDK